MNIILYVSLLCCILFLFYTISHKIYMLSNSKITTPDQALAELIQGNKKYNSFLNFIAKAKRKSVATIQRPFAIVLNCSDSRVPTEIVFNQLDVGSLFTVRNAGNVADGVALGSIEFGVESLGALLIIVLGHERCGAVEATISSIIKHSPEQSGHIKDIINAITPAAHNVLHKNNIDESQHENLKGHSKTEIINDTVKENVRLVIENLYNNSKIISQALDTNKIKIVGAYYDLDNGNIKIIT